MRTSLMVAGFGGQGVMMIGKLIGECAFEQGYHVTFLPSYGPEQRGGTANCTVIQSDRPIGSPVSGALDVLCAMNQPAMEKYIDDIKPGGVLMVNTSLVDLSGIKRRDLQTVEVDADRLADEIGSRKVANIVMLAVYMELIGTVPEARQIVLKKLAGKPQFQKMNEAAFSAGAAIACKAMRTREEGREA